MLVVIGVLVGLCALPLTGGCNTPTTAAPPVTTPATTTPEKPAAKASVPAKVDLLKLKRPAVIARGDASLKQVALTFDDGPHEKFTPRLLEVLKKCNVRATFFIVGRMADKFPSLVLDEALAGHEIGNHTYNHMRLKTMTPEQAMKEITDCNTVLQNITGQAPYLFRPPGGFYPRGMANLVKNLGYTVVLWTDNPGDYAKPGAKVIMSRTMRKLSNGSIILLHDGMEDMLAVLPDLIATIRKQGYEFVTVSELIANSAAAAKKAEAAKKQKLLAAATAKPAKATAKPAAGGKKQ